VGQLKGLEKVDHAISEGKLGIARDSLHGLIITYPRDVSIRTRLGDVNHQLGYSIEAGRYWFLDDDLNEEKENAIAAFKRSCSEDPAIILKRLKLRCRPEDLSTVRAQQVVQELIELSGAEPKSGASKGPAPEVNGKSSNSWWGAACAIVFLVVLSLLVIGFSTVVRWLSSWISQ
jgi:hypothetical protein